MPFTYILRSCNRISQSCLYYYREEGEWGGNPKCECSVDGLKLNSSFWLCFTPHNLYAKVHGGHNPQPSPDFPSLVSQPNTIPLNIITFSCQTSKATKVTFDPLRTLLFANDLSLCNDLARHLKGLTPCIVYRTGTFEGRWWQCMGQKIRLPWKTGFIMSPALATLIILSALNQNKIPTAAWSLQIPRSCGPRHCFGKALSRDLSWKELWPGIWRASPVTDFTSYLLPEFTKCY